MLIPKMKKNAMTKHIKDCVDTNAFIAAVCEV